MITDGQARSAAKSIAAIDLMDYPESVRSVLHWACRELASREQHDDEPITAEWCRENGGEPYDESDCHGELLPCYRWAVGRVWVVIELWSDGVVVSRVCRTNWKENPTNRQLLALLAALRGEPSGNPGQLPNIGPQRAADLEKAGRRSNPAAGCVLRHGA